MDRRHPLSDLELRSLLAVARLGDDAYGVAIHDDIEDRTGRGVSMAAVYAALRRLEARGMVSTWMSDPTPEPGGRARKHFALEPEGGAALAEARAVRERSWEGIDPAVWGGTA